MNWQLFLELIVISFTANLAWRGFSWQNFRQCHFLWFGFILITTFFWLMPTPTKINLGFPPHFIGLGLAYWLFGFARGFMAMSAVVLLWAILPYTIKNPEIQAPLIAQIINQFFFAVFLPMFFFTLWRVLLLLIFDKLLIKKEFSKIANLFMSPTNAPPTTINKSNFAEIFTKTHLSSQSGQHTISKYFLHFFLMVFFGTGLCTASALFLQAYNQTLITANNINLLHTSLPVAVMIGYGEAFITGLIYSVLRTFKPQLVYPY